MSKKGVEGYVSNTDKWTTWGAWTSWTQGPASKVYEFLTPYTSTIWEHFLQKDCNSSRQQVATNLSRAVSDG